MRETVVINKRKWRFFTSVIMSIGLFFLVLLLVAKAEMKTAFTKLDVHFYGVEYGRVFYNYRIENMNCAIDNIEVVYIGNDDQLKIRCRGNQEIIEFSKYIKVDNLLSIDLEKYDIETEIYNNPIFEADGFLTKTDEDIKVISYKLLDNGNYLCNYFKNLYFYNGELRMIDEISSRGYNLKPLKAYKNEEVNPTDFLEICQHYHSLGFKDIKK